MFVSKNFKDINHELEIMGANIFFNKAIKNTSVFSL